MAAERAQPSDLDLAQRRLAGLEAELCATLEETLRLATAGEHDAAILRLDEQRRTLDAAMEALARDVTGLVAVPAPPRRSRARLVRWIAAAIATIAAAATTVIVVTGDPLAHLATRIDDAERTADPQARLLLIEDVYDSLRRVEPKVAAASTLPRRLADVARRTAVALYEAEAPHGMQQRAAVIVRGLDPDAPVPPRAGSGSPTDPILRKLPRR